MSESLVITIVYEQGEEGWVVASIPEVCEGTDSEPLELVIGA